jgi:hypothetical protein
VNLYMHSPVSLHGVVLNQLNRGRTLPFTLFLSLTKLNFKLDVFHPLHFSFSSSLNGIPFRSQLKSKFPESVILY